MSEIDGRQFIGSAGASAVLSILPGHVPGAAGHVAPSAKITRAHMGMGTQGIRELGNLLADPRIQIVAVCDPNSDSSDYLEWGKDSIRNKMREHLGNSSRRENGVGCPAGREDGCEVVDTGYGSQRGAEKLKACNAYSGFRFTGDKGKVTAMYFGQNPQLLTRSGWQPLFPPQSHQGVAQQGIDPIERNRPWRETLFGGPQSFGSFLNAGPIPAAVNRALSPRGQVTTSSSTAAT